MNVAAVIPYQPDGPERERAFETVAGLYETAGIPVRVGTCRGPWVKASAVADGLRKTDADLLVVGDADSWCPTIADTVDAVDAGECWGVPHREVRRLTASEHIGGRTAREPLRATPGGGIVVLTRSVYEDCPLDARFVGWGHEDTAWGWALTCLYGPPFRGAGTLWHLPHPPAPHDAERLRASRTLIGRYRSARRDHDSMAVLIAEARDAVPSQHGGARTPRRTVDGGRRHHP